MTLTITHRLTLAKVWLVYIFLCNLYANAQTTYIVSVGINNYDNGENSLPCSVNDAKDIAQFFNDKGNAEVFLLLDDNATHDHIIRILKRQFAKAQENDQIIFAYSGHGFEGGLSSYDTSNMLWCVEIQDIMRKSKAGRKMMFIMACHSGTFKNKYTIKDSICYQKKCENVLLFMSSRENEYSWENSAMNNSYFYEYLLKGLKGDADANYDNAVTARELFNYVSNEVQCHSNGEQHPVMYGKFADDLIIVMNTAYSSD